MSIQDETTDRDSLSLILQWTKAQQDIYRMSQEDQEDQDAIKRLAEEAEVLLEDYFHLRLQEDGGSPTWLLNDLQSLFDEAELAQALAGDDSEEARSYAHELLFHAGESVVLTLLGSGLTPKEVAALRPFMQWYWHERFTDHKVLNDVRKLAREAPEFRARRALRNSLRPVNLLAAPEPPTWLVEGLLVADQPCLVGGPCKGMKTTLMLDLALSLASGKPFLGTFPVSRKASVLFFSGESGPATLHETARRIASARGIDLADLPLQLSASLPDLSQPQALTHLLRLKKVEVVIFDPLYLSLPGSQAANLYDMGPRLQAVAQACLRGGATPLLVHHFTESVRPGRIPTLEHLAYAGVKQYARQWILVNRRRAYRPDKPGSHQLVLVAGGSAGHSLIRSVDVEEGCIEPGRSWSVTVSEVEGREACEGNGSGLETADPGRNGERRKGSRCRGEKGEGRRGRVQAALDSLGVQVGGTVAARTLRDEARMSGTIWAKVLPHMVEAGLLEQSEDSTTVTRRS
jgi:hypothetical protein